MAPALNMPQNSNHTQPMMLTHINCNTLFLLPVEKDQLFVLTK